MVKIKTNPLDSYTILKGLSWYYGPIRKFFGPEPGALLPLNLLAALFPHTHNDVSMRILHGYTSVGLLPGIIASFYLFNFINKNLLLGLSLLLLTINFMTFFVNTWISLNSMNIPYGGFFHFFVSVLLVVNFLVVELLKRQSLDKQESKYSNPK